VVLIMAVKEYTLIQISKSNKLKLDKFKFPNRETYNFIVGDENNLTEKLDDGKNDRRNRK